MESYKMLACAVIVQAVTDTRQIAITKRAITDRDDALDFIKSKRLDEYIAFTQLDLNPSVVRKSLTVTIPSDDTQPEDPIQRITLTRKESRSVGSFARRLQKRMKCRIKIRPNNKGGETNG